MSKTSPTQRTLAECRKRKWEADIVERRLRFNVTKDLFGCIDVVAVTELGQTIGIQACAGASHAARVSKCKAEPRVIPWLKAGNFVEVWSWAKRGARGKRKTWQLRIEAVTL